jgi:hypothetical protein
MGNSLTGDAFRLIASGGIEAADFFTFPIFVAVAACSLSREVRRA